MPPRAPVTTATLPSNLFAISLRPSICHCNLSFHMVEIKRKGHSPKENCNGRDISAFSRAAANGKGKLSLPLVYHIFLISRSEGRRVGKEGVGTFRSRGW